MYSFIGIPYNSLKEKIKIINTELKDKKFMDLDGVLYHMDYIGQDEPSAGVLCKNERRCKIC